jgi:hypothetical protein
MDMDSAVNEIGSDLGFDSVGQAVGQAHSAPTSESIGEPMPDQSVDPSTAVPLSSKSKEPVISAYEITSDVVTPSTQTDTKTSGVEPAPQPMSAPKTWRPEAATKWSTIDPVIQAEILKREDDIFKGLEGYKEHATFGKNIKTAIDPYLPLLRQYNIDPIKQISGLMDAHRSLALGSPESKIQMFQRLAKDYNVDLAQVYNSEQETQYIDPQVKTLSEQLNALQQNLQERDRVARQVTQQQLSEQIDKFASDTKSHPYFEEVGQDMANLLQSGVANTLDAAYEQSIWTNPITRAKELSRITAEAEAKKQEDESKRAQDARKATSANVKTTAKSGSATAPLGSMDDTLNETLSRIRARG